MSGQTVNPTQMWILTTPRFIIRVHSTKHHYFTMYVTVQPLLRIKCYLINLSLWERWKNLKMSIKPKIIYCIIYKYQKLVLRAGNYFKILMHSLSTTKCSATLHF